MLTGDMHDANLAATKTTDAVCRRWVGSFFKQHRQGGTTQNRAGRSLIRKRVRQLLRQTCQSHTVHAVGRADALCMKAGLRTPERGTPHWMNKRLP